MFRRLTDRSDVDHRGPGRFARVGPRCAWPGSRPVPGRPTPKIKGTQEENLKFFKKFADEMLRLAQRQEKSDNPDDRERAKSLRGRPGTDREEGVENLFKDLLKGLATKNPNSGDFNTLLGKDAKLIAALQEILAILETEDETDRIRRQIKEIEEAIKAIKEVKTRRRSPAQDREPERFQPDLQAAG